jgi:WhiB family redox-sensing transcriptional regulator
MTAAQWSEGAAGPVLNLFDELSDPGSAWQDSALCAQSDPERWFPPKGGNLTSARRICERCPVTEQCLEYALEIESRPEVQGRFGIYGGKTASERDDIVIARRAESAA